MLTEYVAVEERIALAKEYFTKVDLGDPRLIDMFTADAQVYFPTYGIAHGQDDILGLILGLTSAVPTFHHDQSRMIFTQSGNRLVVEGLETGIFADGRQLPGRSASGGLFCNVFEFRDTSISRLHIYTDPDYSGVHTDLFDWEQFK